MVPARAVLNFIPSSYGTPSDALATAGVCVVNNDWGDPDDGVETTTVAVALVNPVADAVTVAVPAVVGVKFDVATPPVGVTTEGLNVPETPFIENVIGFVAAATGFPFASWIVAV